jgi:hypothetical protein
MRLTQRTSTLCIAGLATCAFVAAQQQRQSAPSAIVPRLVNFSGRANDAEGKASAGVVGLTFSIYKDQYQGAPLWMETQSVHTDAKGSYTVQLGATLSQGLPLELFSTGEARWLGVRVNGGDEQPRILLLSVPYALKAADAETVGGFSPAAFVLASSLSTTRLNTAVGAATNSAGVTPALSGTGTANVVPLWTDSKGTLGNSVLSQLGSGATAKIGIDTTAPATTLDVKGTSTFRGAATLPAISTATAAAGNNSQPLNFAASAFSSSTKKALNETFRWQAEAAANDTSAPTASLNLLFGAGTAAPKETGLVIANNGIITFAKGQVFPGGNGSGTITGVTAGTGLKGGGTSGAVTLSLDTTKIAQLNAANTFTGNQTVNGNLSSTGVVTGTAFQIGSALFAFGSTTNQNAFLGFAGNTTTTGNTNVAVGLQSMAANTSGVGNTALGGFTLTRNTTGGGNIAIGTSALFANTIASGNVAIGDSVMEQNQTGVNNTATGIEALMTNSSGSINVADGLQALTANTTGSDNTAIGSRALYTNVSGGNNTAVGENTLIDNTTGTFNTAIGDYAGIGGVSGSNNTFLGTNSGVTTQTPLINATAVGANAEVGASNALVLGGTGGAAVSVGIGTSTPFSDYALDVEAVNGGAINGGVVSNASGGNLYLGMTKGVHKFRVDTNGAVFADGGINPSGADFAESVAVRGAPSEYEPGDVLQIDRTARRGLALSQHPYATLVAGIYSTKPGVLASPHNVDDRVSKLGEVPLAIVGIVPCKVTSENGSIAAGDLLVTSSRPGYAMKGTNRKRMLGAVVGKALEPLEQGSGVIEVLVTLQ